MSDLASTRPGPANGGSAAKARQKIAMTPADALGSVVSLMNEGKLGQAEHICRQIIQARPKWADAHNVFGAIKFRQGQVKEGIKSVRQAIKLTGSVASYHANLGEMLRQDGETDKAITALRRSTRLDPNSPQGFNNLGIAYFDKAKFENAVEMYRKAIALDPSYPEPHNNLGNALTALGKMQEAGECFAKAIELRPDYAEAHTNAATLLGGSGRFEEAEAALRRAVELRPSNVDACRHLANVLLHQNKTAEAIRFLNQAGKQDRGNLATLIALVRAHLKHGTSDFAERIAKEAMSLDPDHPEVLCLYAQACHELDRFNEAIEYYEKALEKRPEYSDCRHYLAVSLKSVGDFERAEAELRYLIDKQPGMITAYASMADLIKFTEDHPYFLALQKLVEDMGDSKDDRVMFLHYAIAKAYDDIGDYDSAFRHYNAGAELKRVKLDYKEEKSIGYFDGVVKTYDAAFFSDTEVEGHPSTLPIFIVGMARSGSTLVEQVLASHPEVYGAGEIKLISRSFSDLRRAFPDLPGFPEIGAHMKASHYEHIARHYLDGIASLSEDASFITDKLLSNFFLLGIIYKAFPNARVIHTVRNPVDTCLSSYTKLYKDEMPFSYDLSELGRYYKRYQALMDHWKRVLPPGYMLEIKYEDMVATLEEKAKEIVAFCGLDWDEQCLRFHDSDRPVKTASVTQVRKPIYSTSVERWRRYEKQLQPLLQELGSS